MLNTKLIDLYPMIDYSFIHLTKIFELNKIFLFMRQPTCGEWASFHHWFNCVEKCVNMIHQTHNNKVFSHTVVVNDIKNQTLIPVKMLGLWNIVFMSVTLFIILMIFSLFFVDKFSMNTCCVCHQFWRCKQHKIIISKCWDN